MSLFKQHAKSEAVSVLVWAVMLGAVLALCASLYATVRDSGSLAEMQKTFETGTGIIKALAGGGGFSLMTVQGWLLVYGFGPVWSVPVLIFLGLFAAGIVTREVDRRTIEFVLAQPISRAQLLVSRWAVMVVSLILIQFAQWLGIWGGVAYLGETPQLGLYAVALTNALLVYLFLGSLMLAVSVLIDDYSRGVGAMLGIGLGFSFFHIGTSDATGALKSLREVLPFGLYDPGAILSKGEVPWAHLAILFCGSLIFLWLAVWLFDRKQIAV